MEWNTGSGRIAHTTSTSSSSISPTTTTQSGLPCPHPAAVVMSPCAACKVLRRRCATQECILAPYFPPSDPLRFIVAHRVFGASNIIKLLQELPECERADAVSSMVYEANARIRSPVYGCAGTIFQLQNQVVELQAELAKTQAELLKMHCQHQEAPYDNSGFGFDDTSFSPLWEPFGNELIITNNLHESSK